MKIGVSLSVVVKIGIVGELDLLVNGCFCSGAHVCVVVMVDLSECEGDKKGFE